MTQQELAEKAGISHSSIARQERSDIGTTVHTLVKVARAFGKQLEIKFVSP